MGTLEHEWTLTTPGVSRYLLWARQVGEEAYQWFEEDLVRAGKAKTMFYYRLAKVKLKIFSDMNNKVMISVKGKDTSLYADRILLYRWFWQTGVETVMVHPLQSMLWTISTPGGLLCRTTKSAVAHALLAVSLLWNNPKPTSKHRWCKQSGSSYLMATSFGYNWADFQCNWISWQIEKR